MNRDIRVSLKADIAAHLLENGPSRWRGVMDRHPEVSEATFWRYVKQVREAHSAATGENIQGPHGNSSAQDHGISEPGTQPASRFAYLWTLRGGDLIVELAYMAQDAELLRAHALDSDENVRRPQEFLKYLNLRYRIFELGLNAMDDIYDLIHAQRFYDRVVEVVVGFVPEDDQPRVIQELRALAQEPEFLRQKGY